MWLNVFSIMALDAKARDRYNAQARLLKALACPSRLLMVEELAKGERWVCDLAGMVGAPMATVSRHLAQLKHAGIVEDDKRGAQVTETAPFYGASLLLAYGVGHCSAIVLAGTFTEIVQRFLNWNEQSQGVTIVKSVCGVLVILGGLWLIYSAP